MRKCTIAEVRRAVKICFSCLLPLVELQRNDLNLYTSFKSEISVEAIAINKEIHGALGQQNGAFIEILLKALVDAEQQRKALTIFLKANPHLTAVLVKPSTHNELIATTIKLIKFMSDNKYYKDPIILFLMSPEHRDLYIYKTIYDSAAQCYLRNNQELFKLSINRITVDLQTMIARYRIIYPTNTRGKFMEAIGIIKLKKRTLNDQLKASNFLAANNYDDLQHYVKKLTDNFTSVSQLVTNTYQLLVQVERNTKDRDKLHSLLFASSPSAASTTQNNSPPRLAPSATSE